MPQLIQLVNASSKRSQQIQIILEFLGYDVALCTFQNVNSQSTLKSSCAVFVENHDLAAATITRLRKQALKQPIILVVDQSAEQRLEGSPIADKTSAVISWPVSQKQLSRVMHHLGIDQTQLKSDRRSIDLFRSLSGDSLAIQQTRQLIHQVADRDVTVLILGESGTGKEVVARNLHYYSARRHQPFVPVNCGAIPAELLESELFGHEKGAFTGAFTTRQGRFELAEGGTLFLDEIGDMPLSMQVKLLRVIQERTFERVGGTRTFNSNVRIIAATHHDLEQSIKEKSFREDLYYRLNVFPIQIPALRERSEDIPVLIADLTARLEREKKFSIRFTIAALQQLQNYPWPGNVRELANLVERMAILIPDGVVDVDQLPDKFTGHAQSINETTSPISSTISDHLLPDQQLSRLPEEGINLKEHLLTLEQCLISQALDECNGVVAQAARKLHINRTTLVEKMRKFGFDRVTE